MDHPTTEDALFDGAVIFSQPARGHGYRANVDALLLADFATREHPARLALDLGAGVGTVALCLDHFGAARSFVLVEKEPNLALLAEANLARNGLHERGKVVALDLAHGLSAHPELLPAADLVVANPPFVRPDRGRPAAPNGRSVARYGELRPFLQATSQALARKGRACLVYPAHAFLELVEEAQRLDLEPKRLRMVHGAEDRPARVALIELARAKPGGLIVLPPLIESEEGRPSGGLLSIIQARRKRL